MEWERHCWAEVDLDALTENFRTIQIRTGARICGVVKADAYGHGAPVVARTLEGAGAAAFAVSCLAEGRELRRAGIRQPILILGYTDPAFAGELAALSLTQTLLDEDYARRLSHRAVTAGCTVTCHLKADTGMGRIGFALRDGFEAAVAQMEGCCALPGLRVTGLFQHFAVADSPRPGDDAYTAAQYDLFCRAVHRLRADGVALATCHCANSAAQLRHPDWRWDLVRAGIILYGLPPGPGVDCTGLRPVLALKAVVTQVKTAAPGQSFSYGRTFTAAEPLRVATVCVGYGDGYPRQLSNRGQMTVRGQAAPVIGRVCMDQTLLDVTAIPGVRAGDEVTVFGAGAAPGTDTAETVAAKTGTIPYAVVCDLTRRVPRVYRRGGAVVALRQGLA